jgi:hypothetical protein
VAEWNLGAACVANVIPSPFGKKAKCVKSRSYFSTTSSKAQIGDLAVFCAVDLG